MSKSLVEIKGFEELEKKLKTLGNDKIKNREVLKILGQVANTTVKAAKSLAPVSRKAHSISGKNRGYKLFKPGNLKKSIGKKTLRRARNPMLVVRANSRKAADGFYGRQFVIRGTVNQKANPFTEKAYQQTKGKVSRESEEKVAKYIQKQINKLSK